jgi:hypothetical protein
MRLRREFVFALLALVTAYPTHAQVAGRIIDDVDIAVHSGYTDVNLLFACGLRYLNHLPASEGDALRIRAVPLADCMLGNESLVAPILPSVSRSLLLAVDIDRPIATEVDIAVRWRKSEKFLVIPTADGRGLRIRVLRPSNPNGRVYVGAELGGRSANYAINLESSHEPFAPDVVAAAEKNVGVHIYVSQIKVEDEDWYRLRAGPFVAESDATRSLLVARTHYPKAWLAIGDDDTLTAANARDPVTAAVEVSTFTTATLTAQEIEPILKQAKTAFRKKDYATAIPLLTKLLEQPEFPQRAEAQELIGLSRERIREIAHAKAEYEEYLRRYPNGPAAERIRQRLHALNLAARKTVRGLGGADESDSPWKIYGGFSQLYRRDNSQLVDAAVTTNTVSQNALLNDFAFIARRHGDRFDFSSRVGASYTENFIDNGLGNQTRVGVAVAELSDRQLGWRARLGRQSVSASGVYGTFDGLYLDYQWLPRVRISLAGGSPVETAYAAYNGDRRFTALAANFGPFATAWDISAYTILQQFQGQTDRRALGTEVHYFAPGRTFIGLVDYDFYYRVLNNVLLIGTTELPARWTLNINFNHSQSPALSIRNALIGQSTTSVTDLLAQFTREELDQLARDRTAATDLYSVSISHPLGELWQMTLDASRIAVGATPDSGGVQAIAATPPEMAYSILGIGNSVFTSGDLDVIALRYQDGSTVKTSSLGLSTRWPLWSAWRLGPQFRVDRRQFAINDSTEILYVPSLRLDYQRKRMLLEFEGGTEIGKSTTADQTQKTTRTYFSLGYRFTF